MSKKNHISNRLKITMYGNFIRTQTFQFSSWINKTFGINIISLQIINFHMFAWKTKIKQS